MNSHPLYWPVVAIFIICVGLAVYWALGWWADRQGGLVPQTPEQIPRSKFLHGTWNAHDIHDLQSFGDDEIEKARRSAVMAGFLKASHHGTTGEADFNQDDPTGCGYTSQQICSEPDQYRRMGMVLGFKDLDNNLLERLWPDLSIDVDPTDDMPHTVVVEQDADIHTNPANDVEPVDFNLYRRARAARKAQEATMDQEIWVIPQGGCTDEQMAAVAKIIDAEESKS